MSFQEDIKGKYKRQTSRQAITLAMEGLWQESITVNKGIIENFPNDVDAHNRLGKAYMELGDYARSKESYSLSLQLDKFNTIAQKNLARLARIAEKAPVKAGRSSEQAPPYLFIEEIGKAGVMDLSQIAAPEVLNKIMPGDLVKLKVKDLSLVVETIHEEYVGLVPSKQGKKLIKLMAGGNKYAAAVVSLSQNSVSLIVRETYQDPSQIDQVSFGGKKLEEVLPYTSDRGFITELDEEDTPESVPLEVVAETHEDEPDEKEWDQEA